MFHDIIRIVLLTFLICLASSKIHAASDTYHINPGDILDISVWKEDGLHHEVQVLPDGTISFPLIGAMNAEGMSLSELEAALKDRMHDTVPDAAVTVIIKSAVGYRIYVTGQVNKPGEYPATRPVTIMQALSIAGGLSAYASESGIRVLRQVDGKETAFRFDYAAVKRGSDLQQDIILQPGDTVVVPNEALF